MWSIDSWDTEAKLQSWETTYTPTWPDLLDNVTGTDTMYGITAAPTLVIIDSAGVVRFTHVGNPGSATLISEIQSLLPPPELSLEGSKSWYWTGKTVINSVAKADVDGDGNVEIVTGGTYYDGTRDVAQLAVWNGATLALENIRTWYWTGNTYISSVAVGDVDGDAQVEIVTGGSYQWGAPTTVHSVAQLIVWNGKTLALENVKTWQWESNTNINSVSIGNVDADGAVEIVTGGSYSYAAPSYLEVAQLCVWNGASLALENVRTWYWTGSTRITTVSAYNVDGDGQLEIVTGGFYYDGSRWVAQLCVWNGATMALENIKTWYWGNGAFIHSISCGNVDGDGYYEIVTGGEYYDGTRYVAQLCVWNGVSLALENIKTWYWTSNTYINSVAMDDVDNDVKVEIVTGGTYYDGTRDVAQLAVWNGATLALENIRTWYWTDDTSINSVAVGHVDKDSNVEIVTGGTFYDGTRQIAQLCIWA